MIGELNIYGVFVPALFAWALIALCVSWALRHVLASLLSDVASGSAQ